MKIFQRIAKIIDIYFKYKGSKKVLVLIHAGLFIIVSTYYYINALPCAVPITVKIFSSLPVDASRYT